MLGWIEAGTVTWRQTVDHGLDRAPGAFLNLFSGGNVGKMLVKLSRTAAAAPLLIPTCRVPARG